MSPPTSLPESLRILVITVRHLFPHRQNPTAGIFFANLLARLRPHVQRLVVVAPVAYVPACLRRLPRFSRLPAPGHHETWHQIPAYHPPYFSLMLNRRLGFQSRTFCLAAAPVCEALHRRHDFNLVLGGSLTSAAHTAQVLAARFGCPSVTWAVGDDVHTHPFTSEENLRLLRHNVRRNTVVLTVSEALRQEILRRCPGAGHVHTFYRGIDLTDIPDRPDRAALRARLGLAPDRLYMMTAGHIGQEKGSDEFYEAFRLLSQQWPTLAALWIGEGPLAPRLREQAQRHGLADRLLLPGKVPRARLLQYMQAADVMAFASYAEGLPNVVMEALACGLPTVATRVGGTPEILADGITGLLVPPKDAAALAGAVGKILREPAWARQAAARGGEHIRRYFNVDRSAPVLLSILRQIAAGGRPAGPLPACAGLEPGRLPRDVLARDG